MKFNKQLTAIISLLFITSCVETVIVGSVASTRLAVREKTLINTKDDINIAARVVKNFSTSGLKVPGNAIDVMVNEKRVLLTGIVSNAQMARKAVHLAWKVKGVSEVIDEIQIARNNSNLNGFRTYSKDAVITTQIEGRIFFTKDASTVNVKINTVNSVVYLLGVAKDDYEIEKITNIIAKIKGVRKVVSHLIKIDDARRRA